MIIQFGVHIMESYFPYEPNDENRNGPRKKMTGKFQSESFYFVLFPVKGVTLSFMNSLYGQCGNCFICFACIAWG